MAFMELFTEYGDWYVVDGDHGGDVIPSDVIGKLDDCPSLAVRRIAFRNDANQSIGPESPWFADHAAALRDYHESTELHSIELVRGWCARYSAPGYMDCTPWCGPYATEDEAEQECRALYGDDEDEDDSDEDAEDDSRDSWQCPGCGSYVEPSDVRQHAAECSLVDGAGNKLGD